MQIDLTGKRRWLPAPAVAGNRAISLSLTRAVPMVINCMKNPPIKPGRSPMKLKRLGGTAKRFRLTAPARRRFRIPVTHAARSLGGLDILVNNAGIARGGPVGSMTAGGHRRPDQRQHRGVVIAIQELVRT